MPLSSDNRLMVLQLLAETGRITRKCLFDILPFSERNIRGVLQKLMDDHAIGLKGGKIKNEESHYLLPAGRKELASFNPQRYTPELWAYGDVLKRNPQQSRLCGDVAAAMALAGYAVHPADRPELPATTPDFQEYTATALKTLYRNEREQPYGEILPNNTRYAKRITPMNCYYDRMQLKLMRDYSVDNGVRSARAAGVLFTPSHLFRVYHGEYTNIKFFSTGEKHFLAIMDEVFRGYLPPEKKAVLLVGREFKPAISLLSAYMHNLSDPNHKGTLLGPSNLGAPLHYLPLHDYALELLRVMRYPDWHKTIPTFATEHLYGVPDRPTWTYTIEDKRVFIVADLNLTNLAYALQQARKHPEQHSVFVCLPWQALFVQEMIHQHCDDYAHATLECLPGDFLTGTAMKTLEDYWGGGNA